MKILIVRTSSIGDIVQTLPVLEYLRKKCPDAQIDWLIENKMAPLIEHLVDNVIIIDTKQWAHLKWIKDSIYALRGKHYDLVFDLQGNIKSGIFTLLAKSKEKVGFGWYSVREKPNMLVTSKRFDFPVHLNIRDKYLQLIQAYFQDTTPFHSSGVVFHLTLEDKKRLDEILPKIKSCDPILMVTVGSRWQNKKINEQTFSSLLRDMYQQTSATLIFVFSNQEEREWADRCAQIFKERSIIIGDLSLPLWQSLMWHVDGVVAVDSAALHLAATTTTPTFSVFGPTSSLVFKPSGNQHHAYQGNCPYGKVFDKQCPILRSCSTGACIQDIPYKELHSAFYRWLEFIKDQN